VEALVNTVMNPRVLRNSLKFLNSRRDGLSGKSQFMKSVSQARCGLFRLHVSIVQTQNY
jgi:hypothetical protein